MIGISMSIVITSGRSTSARSIASRPLLATPTTSIAGSASNRAASAPAKVASSSTTKTRIGAAGMGTQPYLFCKSGQYAGRPIFPFKRRVGTWAKGARRGGRATAPTRSGRASSARPGAPTRAGRTRAGCPCTRRSRRRREAAPRRSTPAPATPRDTSRAALAGCRARNRARAVRSKRGSGAARRGRAAAGRSSRAPRPLSGGQSRRYAARSLHAAALSTENVQRGG